MGGAGVIDHFLEVFTRYIDGGFGLLGGEVGFIATTLIVIDVTLAALFWSWGADDNIIARLVKKTLFVGIFAYLISNWNNLARIIFESFAGLGLKASGTGFAVSDLMRPGKVAQTGLDGGVRLGAGAGPLDPLPFEVARDFAAVEVAGAGVGDPLALATKDVGRLRRAFAEWWLPRALLRGLRASPLAATKWDGVVWYSPSIFLGPVVRAVKRRCGCRGYLILRDLFPDWAVDAGVLRRGLAYRMLKRVERGQYAAADVIGVQSAANIPRVAADSPPGARIGEFSRRDGPYAQANPDRQRRLAAAGQRRGPYAGGDGRIAAGPRP